MRRLRAGIPSPTHGRCRVLVLARACAHDAASPRRARAPRRPHAGAAHPLRSPSRRRRPGPASRLPAAHRRAADVGADLAPPRPTRARPTPERCASSSRSPRQSPAFWLHAQDLTIRRAASSRAAPSSAARIATVSPRPPGHRPGHAPGPRDGRAVARLPGHARRRAQPRPLQGGRGRHARTSTRSSSPSMRGGRSRASTSPRSRSPGRWRSPSPPGTAPSPTRRRPPASPVPDGWVTVRFAQTRPLARATSWPSPPGRSTWWPGAPAGHHQTPLRFILPQGHRDELAYAQSMLPRIVALLEDATDVPYPYGKLDVLVVPRFWGTMEHPGLVALGQPLMLLPPGVESLARQQRGDHHHPRARPLLVRRPGHHGLVGRHLAERVLRQLDRRQGHRRGSTRRGAGTGGRSGAAPGDGGRRAPGCQAHPSAGPLPRGHRDVLRRRAHLLRRAGPSSRCSRRWIGEDAWRSALASYLRKYSDRNATSEDLFSLARRVAGPERLRAARHASSTSQGSRSSARRSAAKERGGGRRADAGAVRLRRARRPREDLGSSGLRPGGKGQAGRARLHAPRRPHGLTPAARLHRLPGLGAARRWRPGLLPRCLRRSAPFPAPPPAARARSPPRSRSPSPPTSPRSPSGARSRSVTCSHRGVAMTAQADSDVAGYGWRLLDGWLRKDRLTTGGRRRRVELFRKLGSARARAMGWTPRPGDSLDVRELRRTLLPRVALGGDDRSLQTDATRLARSWLDDRRGPDEDVVELVLEVAAARGDAALFDAMTRDAVEARARNDRTRIIEAIGWFESPALAARARKLLRRSTVRAARHHPHARRAARPQRDAARGVAVPPRPRRRAGATDARRRGAANDRHHRPRV